MVVEGREEEEEENSGCGSEGGIRMVRDEKLVRGLDYYCHTCFEFVSMSGSSEKNEKNEKNGKNKKKKGERKRKSTALGAQQSTVLAGGRYDGLYGVLSSGAHAVPAIGWAMGMDRIRLMLEAKEEREREREKERERERAGEGEGVGVGVEVGEGDGAGTRHWPERRRTVAVLPVGEKSSDGIEPYFVPSVSRAALAIGQELRCSKLVVEEKIEILSVFKKGMKQQLKFANHANASMVVIVGENEINKGTVLVKDMVTREQVEIKMNHVAEWLGERMKRK